MMSIKSQMDAIYRDMALETIPWNLEKPPTALANLVESGRVVPCDAVDLGCGAGNYAVWLATRGFRMTGLDISDHAVAAARSLAEKRGAQCHFESRDMTSVVTDCDAAFDFAYDWEVLHHVFPENRSTYADNVHRMLRPGATYFSVCFSEDEPASFGGSGKLRKTQLGTTLYFSSEEEIRLLFERLFHIHELTTAEVAGKHQPHLAIQALMTRRDS